MHENVEKSPGFSEWKIPDAEDRFEIPKDWLIAESVETIYN